MLEHAIEGWMVRVSLGYLEETWTVRGYTHPDGALIATPYMRGSKRVKAYDLAEVPSWLLEFIPCIGREAPRISERVVTMVLDPEGSFKVRKGDINGEVLELLDYLDPEWVGLTGSWAIAGEREDSDVDLLVYGDHSNIYATLRDLRDEGSIRACNVEKKYGKIGDMMSWRLYLKLSTLKLLDSCFKGAPYTLRVLRTLEREQCRGALIPLGYYKATVKILDTSEAHLTPARYEAEIEGFGGVTIETWHTRYMELPRGIYKALLRLTLNTKTGAIIASPDMTGWIEEVDF